MAVLNVWAHKPPKPVILKDKTEASDSKKI